MRRTESTVRKLRLQLEELAAKGSGRRPGRSSTGRGASPRRGPAARSLGRTMRPIHAWRARARSAWLTAPRTLRCIVNRLSRHAPNSVGRSHKTSSSMLKRTRYSRRGSTSGQSIEPLNWCAEICPTSSGGSRKIGLKKDQAAQAARAAIEQLGDVSEWEMKLAATAAVKPFVNDIEHERRCAQLPVELPWRLTSHERANALEQVRAAMSQLPASATLRELEVARDNALTPFRLSLIKREHQECCERLLSRASLAFSLVMSHADRENALREVRGAVSKLPVGTSEQDVSAVRDQAMDGIWKERTPRVCRE